MNAPKPPERRIYKYGTGQTIPDGAVYLGTVTQTLVESRQTYTDASGDVRPVWVNCWLVWHYFLVEVAA